MRNRDVFNMPVGASGAHRGIMPLLAIAFVFGIAHMLTNGQYGFHRDEWQFLSDARHLDWGFVPYPPLTAAVQYLGLQLFGLSLVGLRTFSVLAQVGVLLATGLMVRDLGGRRLAQVFAMVAVGLSPVPMFQATEFQYGSFDLLWWVLLAWSVIRLLRTDDPRWWLAIGLFAGLGLQTKYSIVFELAGVLAGALFTGVRRHAGTRWFWAGGALALVIVAPNLAWLIRHDFVSYDFLQSIHARDVRIGRADGFVRGQFLVNANLFAAPVWIAGLVACLLDRRYRMLAWMVAVPLMLFLVARGRFYYTAGVYPMLLAMGSVVGERWVNGLRSGWRTGIVAVMFVGVAAIGTYAALRIVPIASAGPLRDFALEKNGDLREQVGWHELVAQVAAIRDSLPAGERASVAIAVGNYGEYGALSLLGDAYGLPEPISAVNSGWLRGYPSTPPGTFIVLGSSRDRADELFRDCRLAGHSTNAWGVKNEESEDHPDIFVCGPTRLPLGELWRHGPEFG